MIMMMMIVPIRKGVNALNINIRKKRNGQVQTINIINGVCILKELLL